MQCKIQNICIILIKLICIYDTLDKIIIPCVVE